MRVFAVEIDGVEDGPAVRFDDGPYGLAGNDECCMNVACDHIYMTKREWQEIKETGDAYFAMLAAREGGQE